MEVFLGKLKQVRLPLRFCPKMRDLTMLAQAIDASIPYTVILDDPLANSYIQNLYAPDDDPKMLIEAYDRSFDQNDELGLNDMKARRSPLSSQGVRLII